MDEITQKPGINQQQKQLGPLETSTDYTPQQTQVFEQKLAQTAQAIKCPNCGTINDAEAFYCSSCGTMLRSGICPNCGSEMDADTDFCEACHSYVRHDICSFCGADLDSQDVYCPACGSPRGGIVCPVCHTLNEFSFCKQCGSALTEEAKHLVAEIKEIPQYQELVKAAMDYNELEMQLPILSERDMQREKASEDFRERVLRLLAQDSGIENVVIAPAGNKRIMKDELDVRKEEVKRKITELLNNMAIPPQMQPAKVRNYAMAQKPIGVRLAWQCNYKQALHSSPCGCAKPQLGGKWVVLGHGINADIKDDK